MIQPEMIKDTSVKVYRNKRLLINQSINQDTLKLFKYDDSKINLILLP